PMVRVPRLLRVVVPFSLTSPVPFRAVVPWRVRAVGVVAGEVRLLRAVPLIVVAMPLATLRLPLMVPPVQENFPPPVKLPGPEIFPCPASAIVRPGPMDTGEARVIAAPCSNCRVPTAQAASRAELARAADHIQQAAPPHRHRSLVVEVHEAH